MPSPSNPTRAIESFVLQVLFAFPVAYACVTSLALLVVAASLREATYHYPLTLLALQNILVTAAIFLYPRLSSSPSTYSFRAPTDVTRLHFSLVPAFLIFVKQACLFEALLHLRSTTFIFLILQPLVDIVQTPPVTPPVIASSLARAFSIAIIILNERDVEVNGLLLILIFTMAQLGETLYIRFFGNRDIGDVRSKVLIATAFAFIGAMVFERVHWALLDFWRLGFISGLLVLILPFGAWVFHGWVIMPAVLGSRPFEEVGRAMDAVRDAIMIMFPLVFWNVLVSPIQVAAYAVVVFYTAKTMMATKEERGPTIMHADGFQQPHEHGAHNRKQPLHKKPLLFSVAFLLLAGIPSALRLYKHPIHVNHATLDKTYTPQRKMDIVVSMYREDIHQLKSLLSSMKNMKYISAQEPRIIIYTKDPEADKPFLLKATGADDIRSLENVGREGHTYLHHIVTDWDNLAAQTIFMQGSVHNRPEFLSRVKTYLSEGTGMLSLGPSGTICRCGSCADRWGWTDDLDLVPKLNEQCKPPKGSKEVHITLKGQFVASAKRIRGRDKKDYEEQLKAIGAPMTDWPHTDPKFKGKTDSMNAPYYGYGLERVWGLLMQCGDVDVARRCPTMLGGLLWGGMWGRRLSDCQCLDE